MKLSYKLPYSMPIKYTSEYRDPELSKKLADNIRSNIGDREIRLMEVCGTHTMSISKNGIRSVLPANMHLLSGPGCPVCVTSQQDIDGFIESAGTDDVILTTFGDLLRVPGTSSSLQREKSDGRDIRVVYSSFDALKIARQNPDRKIVFPGIGFETTAPTAAGAVLTAARTGIDNFYIYPAFKRVVPALQLLMSTNGVTIDGFLLPGHVAAVIGREAFRPFFDKYGVPCVIAGFEPVDILQAVFLLTEMIGSEKPALDNAYRRAVQEKGNSKAVRVMTEVLETSDANWRGIGMIPQSGMELKETFRHFDARNFVDISTVNSAEPPGCACGEILQGLKKPPDCKLFRTGCSPENPVGPCMVSSEGTCAAYYRYG